MESDYEKFEPHDCLTLSRTGYFSVLFAWGVECDESFPHEKTP